MYPFSHFIYYNIKISFFCGCPLLPFGNLSNTLNGQTPEMIYTKTSHMQECYPGQWMHLQGIIKKYFVFMLIERYSVEHGNVLD